jgi:hypothetical protein
MSTAGSLVSITWGQVMVSKNQVEEIEKSNA